MLREPGLIAQWHGWEMDTLAERSRKSTTPTSSRVPTICNWTWPWATFSRWPPWPTAPADHDTRPGHRRMGKVRRGHHRGLVDVHAAAPLRPGTAPTCQPAHRVCGRDHRRWRPAVILALGGVGHRHRLAAGSRPGVFAAAFHRPRARRQGLVRQDTQLGLTVQTYAEHGDGLLVLAEQAPLDGVRERRGRPGVCVHLWSGRSRIRRTSPSTGTPSWKSTTPPVDSSGTGSRAPTQTAAAPRWGAPPSRGPAVLEPRTGQPVRATVGIGSAAEFLW